MPRHAEPDWTGAAPRTAAGSAVERPSGLVVDVLAEAGHPVVPIHPNMEGVPAPLPGRGRQERRRGCLRHPAILRALARGRSDPTPRRGALKAA